MEGSIEIQSLMDSICCKYKSNGANAAELEWVATARQFIEGDVDDIDEISEDEGQEGIISNGGGEYWRSWKIIKMVVKELAMVKPEAYVPQMVAIGPYHRSRPELRETEWWKLSAARAVQRRLCSGTRFVHVVDAIARHERAIRSHYQRYVNLDSETLAWTMAVDASFLLDFLHAYTTAMPSSTGRADDPYNAAILSDLLMLENQIPLFLLNIVSMHQHDPPGGLLTNFVKRVHPFQGTARTPSTTAGLDPQLLPKDTSRHHHLLHLLYNTIAPAENQYSCCGVENNINPALQGTTTDLKTCPTQSSSVLLPLLGCFKDVLVPIFIRLVTVMFRRLPVLLMIKAPLVQILTESSTPSGAAADDDDGFEMGIPSASQLADAGVTFVATNGGISSVAFDVESGTFFLPAITIELHTEVMLRNLVAMEVARGQQPWVLAWYVQLMKGIVDAAQDVRVLRQCGVVRTSPLRRDEVVVEMWNGMIMGSSSWSISVEGMMDELVSGVNLWYKGKWCKVRLRRMLRTKVVSFSLYFSKLSSFVILCLAVMLVAMHMFCFFHHCGG